MAYATLSDLKLYLGVGTTTDDALLSSCLTRAQAIIDEYCGRTFEAVSGTRYYGPGDVDGKTLYLDKDLVSVTTLTNGDGSTISSVDYVLEPRNAGPPYTAIRLKSARNWAFIDADGEIAVAGTWGFSATAPADVVQATIRLAAYLYRQKDAQVFDVTASPEIGVITVPQGFPRDVERLLQPRRRVGVRAI